MMAKTKTEIMEVGEKIENIFHKLVTSPNFVPMVTTFAISTAATIAISLSSGDHSQAVFAVKHTSESSHIIGVVPTKAIFW